jgi:hypothetical protein
VSNAESLTFIFLIVAAYLLRRKFVANNTGFFRKFLGFFRGFYEIVFIPASISMAIWREKEGLSAVSAVLFFYGLGWFIYFCFSRAIRLAKEQRNAVTQQRKSSLSESDKGIYHQMVEALNKRNINSEKTLRDRFATKRKNVARWQAGLDEVWSGEPKNIEFDYEASDGKFSHRKVALTHILISKDGFFYLFGLCFDRNEDRTFRLDSIQSGINFAGRQFSPYEFIEEEIGVIVDWESHTDEMITQALVNALKPFEDSFETLENNGWKVVIDEFGVGLHRYFKNGKLHKTPKLYLRFNGENALNKWYVSDGYHVSSFPTPEAGVKDLLEQVDELNTNQAAQFR